MEKDLLEIWKDRIKTESKYGDKKQAHQRAGVSETTHDNAMKKNTIEELSDAEFDVICEHIKVLDERKQKIAERRKLYAN